MIGFRKYQPRAARQIWVNKSHAAMFNLALFASAKQQARGGGGVLAALPCQ
jgi:hypothetical protein